MAHPAWGQAPPVAANIASDDLSADAKVDRAIALAVKYLAAETPKWRVEHRCASCHHEGNAARALMSARAAGFLEEDEALESTLKWVERPERWHENHGDQGVSDQGLAEIQFGSTLLQAERLFPERFKGSIEQLAKQLAARQTKAGGFEPDVLEGPASPITLGPILFTAAARDVFARAGKEKGGQAFAKAEERANAWLAAQTPKNSLQAASLLIALRGSEASRTLRAKSREMLRAAQHTEGGFGPDENSPAEVFDTALAIIALVGNSSEDDTPPSETLDKEAPDKETADKRADAAAIDLAKNTLLKWQAADGSWEETTRPRGGVSYAHRVATTAWALEALLKVRAGEAARVDKPR